MLTAAVGRFLAPGVAWERATTPAATAAVPKPIPMTCQLVITASAPRVKAAVSHLRLTNARPARVAGVIGRLRHGRTALAVNAVPHARAAPRRIASDRRW